MIEKITQIIESEVINEIERRILDVRCCETGCDQCAYTGIVYSLDDEYYLEDMLDEAIERKVEEEIYQFIDESYLDQNATEEEIRQAWEEYK